MKDPLQWNYHPPIRQCARRHMHLCQVMAIVILRMLSLSTATVPTTASASESETKTLPSIRWIGTLLDDHGNAIPNGLVQIWQTDANGMYDHPSSSIYDAEKLDPTFRYFGTSVTDTDGTFAFVTRRPGLYPERPITHIHCMVWVDNEEKLTTQLYFSDENPPYPKSQVLRLQATGGGEDDDNNDVDYVTYKNISIDLGGGGSNRLTPPDAKGPFYPLEDFFGLTGELVMVTMDGDVDDLTEETGMPSMLPSASRPTRIEETWMPSMLPSARSPTRIEESWMPSTSPSVSPPLVTVSFLSFLFLLFCSYFW